MSTVDVLESSIANGPTDVRDSDVISCIVMKNDRDAAALNVLAAG